MAITLAFVMVVTLSWKILEWIWLKPKRLEKCLRGQGFNGNPYRLLFGDTKDRAMMVAEARSKPMSHLSHDLLPRVLPFLHHTVQKYGKRCIIWIGPVATLNISESELIREVLMNRDAFQKPMMNPFFQMVAPGLVGLEGDEWAKHRKLINPAFHMEKLKFMIPSFFTSSYDIIKKWEKMALETGSCEVDAWSYLHQLSADAISRAAFGSSFEEGRKIFQLITEQLLVAGPLLSSVYIPGWRFLPTRTNKKMKKIDMEIQILIKGIIHKRKKSMDGGDKSKDDLLGMLLQSSFQENTQDGNTKHKYNGLSLEEVINECKTFYLAGQESTSVLLVWTLVLLAKHQNWQSRAREEVLTTFGHNNPDFHGLNHLKTVNMILQEVLRLYPPATNFSRTVCQDTKVGDIFLPSGVLVNLPILLVHQDEDQWGADAKEFKPERFAEGISKATTGNKVSLFSFGWGPRICIGSNFAMIEAKMALSLILQRFSFELSPSYVHAPFAIGTLQPQFGAHIILHRLQ